MRFKVNGDVILSGVLLIVILGYFIMSIQMGLISDGVPDIGLWPFLVSIVGLIACTVVFVRSCRHAKERWGLNVNWKGLGYAAAIVGLTIAFSFCLVPTGYFIATFLYCFGFALIFEWGRENRSTRRKVVFSVLVAFILTIAGFILFQLIFDVRLPEGLTPGLFEVLRDLQF